MIKIFFIALLLYIQGYALGVTVSTPVESVQLIEVFDARFGKKVWTCPSGTILGIVRHQGQEELRCLIVEIH